VAELLVSAALFAFGLWLRGWRRVRREPSAPQFGARTPLVVPIALGLLLMVLGDLAASRLGISVHLRGLLGPLLLFAPSALLALHHDLGARSAGVERAEDRWPFVLGLWLRTWPLLTGVAGLIGWTAEQLGIDSLGVASEVVLAASDRDFAAMVFLGVFVVPLAEELFFRGRLFARLAVHVGPTRANWIQAALFGLAHGWFYFPILTYFGWLLGRARLSGAGMGSLALAHALQNAVSFAVLAAMR